MPLFLAKLLCPHIKSLSLKPELYTRASKAIFSILEKYGPIAPASLDEACKQFRCVVSASTCCPQTHAYLCALRRRGHDRLLR